MSKVAVFSTGFCLFNSVCTICFETEIKMCLTLQQYFLVSVLQILQLYSLLQRGSWEIT